MHDYIALRIDARPSNDTITDLLAAFLAESDYETFEPDNEGITAYIRKDKFDTNFVTGVIDEFPIPTKLTFKTELLEGRDWNKEWEENYFKPINIDDKLLIRSSFHKEFKPAELEIIIDPKMAFGTGHHSTTAGMARMIMEESLSDKSVIDMGTGTGILAILAKKLGAKNVTGIDIDEFAIENAITNSQLNNCEGNWLTGDHNTLQTLKPADLFLANINLNVILANLNDYVKYVKQKGIILLSGFLNTDKEKIMEEARKVGLKFVKELEENNWLTMKFIKD